MLASAARQFPLLCLLVFGVTSAPPEWLKIREDVQEITPWNSSTVTSTEPLTWRIAEGDEFFSLLELDDYQQYLWTAMNGKLLFTQVRVCVVCGVWCVVCGVVCVCVCVSLICQGVI